MTTALDSFMKATLDELTASGRRRSMREVFGAQGPEIVLDGKRVICFCSNNYLNLANHPDVVKAAADATLRYGTGSGASRLISGNMEIFGRLERRIASFKQVEAALLFNSGYHANTGVIPALMGEGDFIYSDELNHASIIDGARLSKATVRVYPHLDVEALDRLMLRDNTAGRKLIVTDSLFSMDGDVTPLSELVRLKEKHAAMLMIDEAHATGVIGPGARGLAAELGLSGKIDVVMGTLGKAIGSFGAFIGGSQLLRDFLINKARSFIFTTGLPPSTAAAALAAIEVLEREPERIAHLRSRAEKMRRGLAAMGRVVADNEIPIIPLIIGSEKDTMIACDRLLDNGIFVQGIRPPTVPDNQSRLRITVTSDHTDEHIERALDAIHNL